MKYSEFLIECGRRLIDPAVVLENENICNALKDCDYDKVLHILDNEY
jgi:hypothetical protein